MEETIGGCAGCVLFALIIIIALAVIKRAFMILL